MVTTLLAVSAGCGFSASQEPTATVTPSDSLTGKQYVAMGDSYTAAPLFPLKELPKGCLRSTDNYPTIVASTLHMDLRDVSCSGASTVSIFGFQHFALTEHRRPPQLDALSSQTALVTIGIGANDSAFFTHMMFDCLNLAPRDPLGHPCQSKNDVDGRDVLASKLGAIKRQVAKVTRAIRHRAPQARVLLIGYPQLLPRKGDCVNKLPLALGDYHYTRRLNNKLVRAVHKGAIKGGAEYVDVERASRGHDICSADPWIAGIKGSAGHAMGLHPFPSEQRAVASLVLGMLDHA